MESVEKKSSNPVAPSEEVKAMYGDPGVEPFFDGLAVASKQVEYKGKKRTVYFHIHPDGTPAYEQRYGFIPNGFDEEGLARVSDLDTGKMFHIHKDGTPAYEQRYYLLGHFYEGLATAEEENGHYNNQFHIKPDGTPAYEARFQDVSNFADGFAWARSDEKPFEWFLIRPDGSIVNDKQSIKKYHENHPGPYESGYTEDPEFTVLNPRETMVKEGKMTEEEAAKIRGSISAQYDGFM